MATIVASDIHTHKKKINILFQLCQVTNKTAALNKKSNYVNNKKKKKVIISKGVVVLSLFS